MYKIDPKKPPVRLLVGLINGVPVVTTLCTEATFRQNAFVMFHTHEVERVAIHKLNFEAPALGSCSRDQMNNLDEVDLSQPQEEE